MLTVERVRELFDYDPETGELKNRVQRGSACPVGKILTSRNEAGYIRCKIDYRMYYVHLVAWCHYFGEWPCFQVDHINLCKSDNRISNLRRATPAENSWNCPRRKDNSTGVKGVHFHRHSQKYVAYIGKNGKRISLGYFRDIESAINARLAAQRIHGEFARIE